MKNILFNISELSLCHSDVAIPGRELSENTKIKNAALVWEDDKMIESGDSEQLLKKYSSAQSTDAKFKAVIPGFVDSHTHLVHAGSRHKEYEYKIAGKSYSELHESGGILYTVEQTRKASKQQLTEQAESDLEQMLLHGTTTVEAKTGYGLNEESELKILEVMKDLKKNSIQDLHLTFLGAHTIPKEYKDKKDEYLDLVASLIPKIKDDCSYLDVWCDPLGFTISQTEKLCQLAISNGLKIKLHVEQTGFNGGAQIAAKFNALSCDHLDCITSEAIKDLAASETVGVLLPSVTYHLMEFSKNIPVSEMISSNMKIALATDYNPGSCPNLSMQRTMEDGLRLYKMTYNQVLNASTINAAFALGLGSEVGSIHPGKKADFLVLDCDEFAKAVHRFGTNHVNHVFKSGIQVVEDKQRVK